MWAVAGRFRGSSALHLWIILLQFVAFNGQREGVGKKAREEGEEDAVFCNETTGLMPIDDLKPEDVLWREEEDALLKQWFAEPSCVFQRIQVEGDGACVVRTIWTWLQRHPDVLQRSGLASLSDLGVALSGAALECIKERSKAQLPNEERRECNRIWRTIQKNPESVKEYWNTPALDYVWIALTTRVLRDVAVEIWQVSPKERRALMMQRYPEEEEGGRVVLRVLRSNPNIAPHYDLLLSKD